MILRSALLFLVVAGTAWAASEHRPSHYAGHGPRAVAALSEEDVAALRSGAGMAMALPAEMNGYPGPAHVLELADRLDLTPDQSATAGRLRAEMAARAVPLGAEVIAAEAALDLLFSSSIATPEAVAEASGRVGRLRGELRAVHLAAHIGMRDALSEDQRRRYARLRGYAHH